jgi:hypothetical protein
MGAEAGKKPGSEGPWTKAGVIIAAVCGVLGLIFAYLGLAASTHWVPFSPAAPRTFATARPTVTASAAKSRGRETGSPSPTANTSSGTTTLAAMYYGTITYPNGGYTSNLQLCSVTDTVGHLTGDLIVWNGPGSGPFSGAISRASLMTFSVSHPVAEYGTMAFSGSIARSGDISGTFVITNPREQGTWAVHASPPFSSSRC